MQTFLRDKTETIDYLKKKNKQMKEGLIAGYDLLIENLTKGFENRLKRQKEEYEEQIIDCYDECQNGVHWQRDYYDKIPNMNNHKKRKIDKIKTN